MPTMMDPSIILGCGLILYFRADNLHEIRANAERPGYPIEEDIRLNENSAKQEISLRDQDGFYLTVTEFQRYGG